MKQKQQRFLACAVGALALSLGWVSSGRAQPQDGQAGFPDLVTSLKQIEGCLGVQTAQAPDGKQLIFGWFEDKQAVARWYWSEPHQAAVSSFFPDAEPSDPLKDVPDNVGPVMAIASITFAKEREIDESTLPISQIAIELYTPISGGLAFGGRFAPAGLKVPKRRIIVDEE